MIAEPAARGSQRTRHYHNRCSFAALPETKTVLVMDKEPTARKILGDIISERLGHQIVEAPDLAGAQSRLSGPERIHLLVMDLSVLDVDGLELSGWFRAIYPETKVLVTSDFLWEVYFQLAASEHISFLSKPFTASQLSVAIQHVLG